MRDHRYCETMSPCSMRTSHHHPIITIELACRMGRLSPLMPISTWITVYHSIWLSPAWRCTSECRMWRIRRDPALPTYLSVLSLIEAITTNRVTSLKHAGTERVTAAVLVFVYLHYACYCMIWSCEWMWTSRCWSLSWLRHVLQVMGILTMCVILRMPQFTPKSSFRACIRCAPLW